jgi:hypothetical protein
LGTFFEMAHPRRYRICISYTNWSGTACFVPVNAYETNIPLLTSTDPLSVMEVQGAVRIQPGASNWGRWCRFPYAQQGWPTYGIGSPSFALPVGYCYAYNDAPVTANWTIQATLEVEVRFFRRTLYNYTITPTLNKTVVLVTSDEPQEPLQEEEVKEISYDKIGTVLSYSPQ